MSKVNAAIVISIVLCGLLYLAVSGEQPHTKDLGIYTVTAYCPKSCCCGRFADGLTASGHKIQPGDSFVAAPPEIPFGTWLIVPGYNDGWAAEVLDRGGKIKLLKLDVFFPTHKEALEWGVQKVRVTRVNYMKE